ncbi:unnamed protein product [Adineta ricciae]|nr:unnamed protein product [Adineta ricciae]
MIDTGATHTLITRSLLDTLPDVPFTKTTSVSALLGDASTALCVHGVAQLCIYVNHIPTFISAYVVDSLGINLILGMDWCRTYDVQIRIRHQKLCLRHSHYGSTSVSFLHNASLPARLAHPVQLQPLHEHVVQLTAPLSSALQVIFTPAPTFCQRKHLLIPDAVVRINQFHTTLLVSNLATTSCFLRENVVLGTFTFFSSSPAAINLTSFCSSPPLSSSPHFPSISAISLSDTESVIDELLDPLPDDATRQTFKPILQKHRRAFDLSTHSIADTTIPHVIITGDHPPVSARPYYRTIEQRKELQHEVDKMLLDNIIRPSTSPWSSPVILKKKPDGSFRFLVDFRRLNAITKKDAYPQPSAEELIYRLSGHSFFTKLDLKSGYFQIPIAPGDREKTAFVTPDGHYEFNVLAQGLTNAPASFQRVMNNLLATGRWDYVVVYLDDIVIFSHSLEEHAKHVDEILSILNNAHFRVSPSKCTIAARQIEFLGHFVSASMVEPSPDKLQAILDIPPPRTLSQANRFLGKIGYYRKFIPDFARIAAPLHKVTNKTRTKRHEFYWHAEQQLAFDQFKQILTSAPLFLHFPDPSLPFILSTDASLMRIAGVLKQDTPSGLKICYYKSRLLSATEQRYSTTEREALAICWCLDQLRSCIGTSSITIETDHQPLANMHKKYSFRNKRIDNWLLKLQDLLPQILSIKYRKGIDNVGPDFLTRYEPSSSSSSPPSATPLPPRSSTTLSDSSWPPGTESWNTIVVSPVVTRSKTRSHSTHTTSAPIPPPVGALTSTDLSTSSTNSPTISPDISLDLSLSRIKTAQHSHPEILSLIQHLRQIPSHPQYILHDDILFRLVSRSASNGPSRIPYLPESLIPLVLRLYHDHPTSGHFGVHRTFLRIRDKFWWPNMRSSIQNYIASCYSCARHNILRAKPPGHLRSIDPPSGVFQLLHLDFWGPVQTPSASGNRYVIVLTDNLSKYVIAQALPDCTARSAAQFLIDRFILLHGSPERILTDNGTHFNNTLLRAITTSMQIPHSFSVAYHPQTNGQVERFNATFAAQLAKYCHPNRHDWDLYLPSIVYAYNTRIHSTTELMPYEVAFGRCPKSPFEAASPRSIFLLSILSTRIYNSHWKQRYNRNRQDPSYSVGDRVYLNVATGRTKLDARRSGPYTILDISGTQTYLVHDPSSGYSSWCHINIVNSMAASLQAHSRQFHSSWRDYCVLYLMVVVNGLLALTCCGLVFFCFYRRILVRLQRAPAPPRGILT